MSRILVVADAPWVRSEVHACLTAPDFELVDLDDPAAAAATALSGDFDAVVVDLQTGSMGGMAVTRDVREQAGLRGREHLPVVMLLDRAADAFLAKRAGAAGWLTKPFDAHMIRAVLASALASARPPAPAGIEET
jgi:DNA-binding response OmpR family regulator